MKKWRSQSVPWTMKGPAWVNSFCDRLKKRAEKTAVWLHPSQVCNYSCELLILLQVSDRGEDSGAIWFKILLSLFALPVVSSFFMPLQFCDIMMRQDIFPLAWVCRPHLCSQADEVPFCGTPMPRPQWDESCYEWFSFWGALPSYYTQPETDLCVYERNF